MNENRLERKRQNDQRKKEVKGVKPAEKKGARKLGKTLKKAEYGERNVKENNKRHRLKRRISCEKQHEKDIKKLQKTD